ncbi:hypothetical protein [Methylomagnum sp.]
MNDSTNRCSLGWKKLQKEMRLGPDELTVRSFILRLERLPPTNTAIPDFCDLLDQGLPVRDASGQAVDSEALKQCLIQAKETADKADSPVVATIDELKWVAPDDWDYWVDKETLVHEIHRADVARTYGAMGETEFPWRDYKDKTIWLSVAELSGDLPPPPSELSEEPESEGHKLADPEASALAERVSLTLVDILDLLGLETERDFWHIQDCECDEAGIRPKPLNEAAKRLQTGPELRLWKDFEQDIRLALPCSPHTFLTWCSRNQFTDVLPPAFVTAMLNRYRSAIFTPLREDYKAALRQDAWTAREALCWLNGRNPAYFMDDIEGAYPEQVDLVKRAAKVGRLDPTGTPPRIWIEWAKEKGWRIPPELDSEPDPAPTGDVIFMGNAMIQPSTPDIGNEYLTLAELLALLAEAHAPKDGRETFRWLVESGLVGRSPEHQYRCVSLAPLVTAQPEDFQSLAGDCIVSVQDLEQTYWLAGQDQFPGRDEAGQIVWKPVSKQPSPDELEHHGEFFSVVYPSYPPHDLKKLRKSLSCNQVICSHDPCEAVVDEPFVWKMAELLGNRGYAVDWNHWAELPCWTGKEAACLIYSVDPFVFESGKAAHPEFAKIPLDDLNACITKLAQHAERSLKEAAPPEWLQWARGRGLGDEIHPRLNALMRKYWGMPVVIEAPSASLPSETTQAAPAIQEDAPTDTGQRATEMNRWLRETWVDEGKPTGAPFFRALKNYEKKKGSPIVEWYSAGKDAGIQWQTSNGAKGEWKRKTILTLASEFRREDKKGCQAP